MNHNRELSEEFGKIVIRMMAKKREDRYQSCHEVLMDLRKTKNLSRTSRKSIPEMTY